MCRVLGGFIIDRLVAEVGRCCVKKAGGIVIFLIRGMDQTLEEHIERESLLVAR